MKVVIKWGKKTFDDVEIDTALPAVVFKTQIYSLTGVPPDRQKIMVKGGMLKDDASWSETGVKAGQKLMLLGTADKLPEAPTSAPTFLEDLPEEQQVSDAAGCMQDMHARTAQAALFNVASELRNVRVAVCSRHQAVWQRPQQPWQYLLHEFNAAMSVFCP